MKLTTSYLALTLNKETWELDELLMMESMDVKMLLRISMAMDHNFLQYFSLDGLYIANYAEAAVVKMHPGEANESERLAQERDYYKDRCQWLNEIKELQLDKIRRLEYELAELNKRIGNIA